MNLASAHENHLMRVIPETVLVGNPATCTGAPPCSTFPMQTTSPPKCATSLLTCNNDGRNGLKKLKDAGLITPAAFTLVIHD